MYGHSKIDPIGALVQGIILVNLYFFLILNAIEVILSGVYVLNAPETGLQLIIISFIVNIVFSRILIWQGKRKKSLSLEIQGFNLFQDSLRAIIVLISFIFAFFGVTFLDPFLSIVLSCWIIIGALNLTKKGIKELTDENPINALILEEIRENIFYLDHVNGITDLKVRASGSKLFLEVHLSVEDHISVIHANEVTKSIRSICNSLIPQYEVECLIEMNPQGGETSIGEQIINLIYSSYTDYMDILNIKDVNLFTIEKEYFLSLRIIVNDSLQLDEAHNICTEFENELKKQAPILSRIITHIEGSPTTGKITPKQLSCSPVDDNRMVEIQQIIETVLRNYEDVKGYHGFEFWTAIEYCVLETHVFFDSTLNIAAIHESITNIEKDIRKKLKIGNLKEIILHSEPFTGLTDGIIF
jgi:cation diffusion facilitator family transporter